MEALIVYMTSGDFRASLAQMLKNPLAVQETSVWADPLEKGMAIHSSILAWRLPLTEEPVVATVHAIA